MVWNIKIGSYRMNSLGSLLLASILVGSLFSGSLASTHLAYGTSVDVTVTILRVIELGCPDLEVSCPNDYYASVNIDDQGYQSSPTVTSSDFSPFWTFTRTVDTSSDTIPIVLELWDSDLFFDDEVDIDPHGGTDFVDLDLTFDLATATWSGDIPDNQGFSQGDGGENRARIFFDIALSDDGDLDDDGIPDGIERFGVLDESGNPIPIEEGLGFPMNPCRKTVAVQLDYMADGPDGHSHHPLKTNALQFVLDAFNNAPVPAVSDCPYLGYSNESGVNLVIDISKTVPHLQHEVSPIDGYSFANGKVQQARQDNFDPARDDYFRYAIWQNQGATASGTNFIVGEVGPSRPIALGGVFMHELGHTLGLAHGGNADKENCKPNYHSVMNYSYGYPLLKFVGGDPTKMVELLDYSRSKLLDLDEKQLFESLGIADGDFFTQWGSSPTERRTSLTGSGPIDWDGDGIIDDIPTDSSAGVSVEVDLNNLRSDCGAVDPEQILHGFNDWENLDYNFRDGFGNAPPPPHEEPAVSEGELIVEMILEPPTIIAPPDIQIIANTAGGALVDLGEPTVSDNIDPNPTVTNDAPAVFPLGTTTVTWTATDLFGNSASDTQLVTVRAVPVSIDIKPRDSTNSVSPSSKELVPVAILTTPTFDANTVDSATVRFGHNMAVEVHGEGHMEDVDKDGDMDMLFHFKMQETDIECGDTSATLTGSSLAGIPIEGSDSVRTVPCK